MAEKRTDRHAAARQRGARVAEAPPAAAAPEAADAAAPAAASGASRLTQRLAQRLGRPPATLAGVARLSPEAQAALDAAVAERLTATAEGLEAELRGLLPPPFGGWLLRWLRRGDGG